MRAPGLKRDDQQPTARQGLVGRSSSIRVKIGLSFGLVVALAVALLAGVLASASVQREFEHARHDHIVLARTMVSLIDQHLDDVASTLALLAADPVLLTELEQRSYQTLNDRLERMANPTSRLVGLTVIAADGSLAALSLRDKSLLGRTVQPDADAYVAMRDQRTVIGAPQRGQLTGIRLVPVTVPLSGTDGGALGSLTGTLSLERLSELIEAVRSETPRCVRVFDMSGTLLVGPDRARVLTHPDDLQALATDLDSQGVARETVADDGTPILATALPISGTSWFVQVEVPIS